MSLSDTKIIGYILLLLGLGQIAFSGLNIYQVFTGQVKPIKTFELHGVSLDFSTLVPPDILNSQTSPKTEIISSSTINDISNLTAHYLLISFLASLGFKVSSLGIQLLRPIEVKLKTASESTTHS
jgi:hypothetical protein